MVGWYYWPIVIYHRYFSMNIFIVICGNKKTFWLLKMFEQLQILFHLQKTYQRFSKTTKTKTKVTASNNPQETLSSFFKRTLFGKKKKSCCRDRLSWLSASPVIYLSQTWDTLTVPSNTETCDFHFYLSHFPTRYLSVPSLSPVI